MHQRIQPVEILWVLLTASQEIQSEYTILYAFYY
jgi:hypothetical protein